MSYRFSLALRYLSERRARTALTILSIVIGVMLIFGLNGMIPALEDSLRQSMTPAASRVDLTVTSESRGVFDQDLVQEANRIPGVAVAAGSLIRTIALPPDLALPVEDGSPLSALNLTGLDFETESAARSLTLVAGRELAKIDPEGVLIPETLAVRVGLAVGDTLRLPAAAGTIDLVIVGLIADPASAAGDEVYVSLPTAQGLLQLPGRINTIEILYAADAEPQATGQAVLDGLGPGYRAAPLDSGTQFITSLEIAGTVFTLFGLLVLVMAGFIIFNTFRTVVAERQRDIGMLRAVGASRRDVIGLMMIESLLQGLAGTMIGLAAGYLFVQGLLAAMGQVWMQRVNFPLGEARFTWQNLLVAVLLGVGVTLIGGLLPAISASRISPIEALRPSMAQVDHGIGGREGKRPRRRQAWSLGLLALALLGLFFGNLALASLGLVLFLVALVLLSPFLIAPVTNFSGRLLTMLYAREGYLAQSNLNRQPNRAAVTVSAMMIGLAILLALTGLVTSITTGVVGNIDRSLGGDFLLMPQSQVLSGGNVGAGPELAKALRQTPGIVSVTTLRATSAQANDLDVQVIGLDPGTYPAVADMDITAGDPERVFQELDGGRTLIVSTIYAARNETELGDELLLNTPEGSFAYEVVGVGSDYLNAQAAAIFISQANLARDFNETVDLLLMADRDVDADPDVLKSRIENLVDSYPALTLFGPGEYRDQILRQGYDRLAIFYVMLAFVAVPSLIALANTLGIGVIERTREIGVLRAVGATRRQVRRVVTAESLLLAVIGIAFGLLAGVWLGYLLVQGLNVFGYPTNYSFPWSGVLLSAFVGLVMALLAALLPARQASKLSIIRALQYE